MQHATCSMQRAACCMQRAACNVQHETCRMQRAADNVQHAACYMQDATCSMQHSAVQIRNKLTDAVDACIAAATHEFDTDRQLALLRSATYGKVSIVCGGWIRLHRLLCALLRMSTLHRRVSAAVLAPIPSRTVARLPSCVGLLPVCLVSGFLRAVQLRPLCEHVPHAPRKLSSLCSANVPA